MKTIIICVTALATCSLAGGTVLFDFETEQERKAAPRYDANGAHVGVTNAFATSGGHALRFACEPWRKGRPEWPSFTLTTKTTDWSGYDRLVVDIVGIGAGGDLFSTYIAGPDGRIQNGLGKSRRVPESGVTQWVVDLDKWPKETSPTNIVRVHFFTERPRGFEIAIDRLTLLKKGEKLPVPDSPSVGREVLAVVAADGDALRAEVAGMIKWL